MPKSTNSWTDQMTVEMRNIKTGACRAHNAAYRYANAAIKANACDEPVEKRDVEIANNILRTAEKLMDMISDFS